MDTIRIDGVSLEVSDLSFCPSSPKLLVKEVRFTTPRPVNRRLTAGHYTPLEFAVAGRRFFGLFRLVSSTPLHLTTQFLYEGLGRPAWTETDAPAVA